MPVSKLRIEKVFRHPWSLLGGLLAFIPFLGKLSIPLTGDQKVYLNTALEMRETGQWLIPQLFGEASYFKPPLQYWATLLGWKIFGFNLWGALLPSAIAGILTGALVAEIAGMLHGRKHYTLAGLWFLSSIGTATYAVTAQMEIWLTLFMSLSWWALLRYLSTPFEMRKVRWIYLAWVSAGVLALVKSPLYSVFVGVGFISYLLVCGEWETLRLKSFWLACVAGVLAGLSWYAAIVWVDGARFLQDYVGRETLQKTGGNGTSWLGIWGALVYLCFPMTFLLIPAARSFLRNRRPGKIIPFLVCWMGPPAFFFTVFPYRVTTYLFVLIPAIAVFMDCGYFRERKSLMHRWMMLFTGFSIFFVFELVSILLNQEHLVPFWLVLGLGFTGALAMFSVVQDLYRGLIASVMLGVFFFHGVLGAFGEQDMSGLKAFVQQHPGSTIGYYDRSKTIWHEYGLLSAATGTRVRKIEDIDSVLATLRSGGGVIVPDDAEDLDLHELEAKAMGLGDRRELVQVIWQRWKKRMKIPVREWMTQPTAIPERGNLLREYRIIYLK